MISNIIGTLSLSLLQCSDPTFYRDLVSFNCYGQCPDGLISTDLPRPDFQSGVFKYCRNLTYFVDGSSTNDIELGTQAYPFRNLDDPFREVYNYYTDLNPQVYIYIKQFSNISIYGS